MLASSSASMLHFRAMLGHLGDKMANKMGKMAAKSAKVSQHRRKSALRSTREAMVERNEGGSGSLTKS